MKKLLLLLILIPITAFSSVLTFTVPTLREDGTPLVYTDIGSYHIYCGTVKGNYTQTTIVPSPAIASKTITFDPSRLNGLVAGKNLCVATTLDTKGRESVYSNMVTINNSVAAPQSLWG